MNRIGYHNPHAAELHNGCERYVLDISKCDPATLPKHMQQFPKQIPCQKGRYSLDYDVIEAELPTEAAHALSHYRRSVNRYRVFDWPIGFCADQLLPGMFLVRVTGNEGGR